MPEKDEAFVAKNTEERRSKRTIDLTPTDDGFAVMAQRFIDSIRSDMKVTRRKDGMHILSSLLDIVRYLSAKSVSPTYSQRDSDEAKASLQRVLEYMAGRLSE